MRPFTSNRLAARRSSRRRLSPLANLPLATLRLIELAAAGTPSRSGSQTRSRKCRPSKRRPAHSSGRSRYRHVALDGETADRPLHDRRRSRAPTRVADSARIRGPLAAADGAALPAEGRVERRDTAGRCSPPSFGSSPPTPFPRKISSEPERIRFPSLVRPRTRCIGSQRRSMIGGAPERVRVDRR